MYAKRSRYSLEKIATGERKMKNCLPEAPSCIRPCDAPSLAGCDETELEISRNAVRSTAAQVESTGGKEVPEMKSWTGAHGRSTAISAEPTSRFAPAAAAPGPSMPGSTLQLQLTRDNSQLLHCCSTWPIKGERVVAHVMQTLCVEF